MPPATEAILIIADVSLLVKSDYKNIHIGVPDVQLTVKKSIPAHYSETLRFKVDSVISNRSSERCSVTGRVEEYARLDARYLEAI